MQGKQNHFTVDKITLRLTKYTIDLWIEKETGKLRWLGSWLDQHKSLTRWYRLVLRCSIKEKRMTVLFFSLSIPRGGRGVTITPHTPHTPMYIRRNLRSSILVDPPPPPPLKTIMKSFHLNMRKTFHSQLFLFLNFARMYNLENGYGHHTARSKNKNASWKLIISWPQLVFSSSNTACSKMFTKENHTD